MHTSTLPTAPLNDVERAELKTLTALQYSIDEINGELRGIFPRDPNRSPISQAQSWVMSPGKSRFQTRVLNLIIRHGEQTERLKVLTGVRNCGDALELLHERIAVLTARADYWGSSPVIVRNTCVRTCSGGAPSLGRHR